MALRFDSRCHSNCCECCEEKVPNPHGGRDIRTASGGFAEPEQHPEPSLKDTSPRKQWEVGRAQVQRFLPTTLPLCCVMAKGLRNHGWTGTQDCRVSRRRFLPGNSFSKGTTHPPGQVVYQDGRADTRRGSHLPIDWVSSSRYYTNSLVDQRNGLWRSVLMSQVDRRGYCC